MKLILNAPAVQTLLETEKEFTVEFAKNAVAQVSERVAKRITNEVIDAKIGAFLKNELFPNNYSRRIADQYRAALVETIREMATGFITQLTSGAMKKDIDQLIRERFEALRPELEAILITEADRLIRARFAAAFALPASNGG